MKKILCLLILTTLIVGCISKPSSENKEEQKRSETKNIEDKKQDEDIKEEDKVSIDDEIEDTKIAQDDEPKNDAPSTNTNTSISNNNSNQSSSGNANGSSNSNNGGSTPPPKQETPTPPKVETPPPPPQPPVPETPIEQRGKADAVMAQINAYRQQNGKPAFLITNYLLDNSKKHAYAMAEKRALWHSGAAECITNYDDPFSAWANSPEHNRLLLSNNETGAVSIYYVDGYYFSVFQTLP